MIKKTISKQEAKQMQPLVLAMIGDSVQTLFVREYLAKSYNYKVNKLNKIVSSVVKAGAQFVTFKKIEENLLEDELEIAHRARNTHIHSKAKNFTITEYIYATAFEAIIGYLYLVGEDERLEKFLIKSLDEMVID